MHALKYIQSVLTLLGVCASDESVGWFRKSLNNLIYFINTGMHAIDATATTLYFVKYVSVDYDGGLYALLAATAWICGFWTLNSLRWHRYTTLNVFNCIKLIRRNNWNTEAFQENSFSNRIGKKVSTFFITFYGPGYFTVFTAAALYNYGYCYFYETLDPDCLILPYKHDLPWSGDTVEGWIKIMSYSTIFGGVYFSVNAMLLASFVTICVEFHSLKIHYQAILSKLNDRLLNDKHSDSLVKPILCESIHFHILAKSLFQDLANASSGTLFVQTVGGIILTATSIFQADIAVRNPTIYIIAGLNVLFSSSANLYLYCYGGDVVTKSFAEFADSLFEVDWFKMPNHLQKLLIVMISETQRPMRFTGYGIFSINLEAFTSMLKKVVSYYLMFRTLAVK